LDLIPVIRVRAREVNGRSRRRGERGGTIRSQKRGEAEIESNNTFISIVSGHFYNNCPKLHINE